MLPNAPSPCEPDDEPYPEDDEPYPEDDEPYPEDPVEPGRWWLVLYLLPAPEPDWWLDDGGGSVEWPLPIAPDPVPL